MSERDVSFSKEAPSVRRALWILLPTLLAPMLALGADPVADRLEKALPALAERLEKERVARHLPSLSFAVGYRDAIVARQALGLADLEKKTGATPSHLYRAGSITKVLLVTALMQQVEEGRMRLDDPLSKYVPEYRVRSPFPDTPPTTLRQLASHTSGLPRDAAVNFWMSYSVGSWPMSNGKSPIDWYVSEERLLETLPTVELERPPDGEPLYSNLGMALLGIAVERAIGRPFAGYVAERILRPLGMADSSLAVEAGRDPRLATAYLFNSPDQPPLVVPEWRLGVAQYTGGLVTTPTDLVRFAAAQFPTADGRRSPILSQDSLRLMHQRVGRSDACLGWWTTELEGRVLLGHTGGHFGFLASIGALPGQRLGVAIMTNSWNPLLGADDTWDLTKMALSFIAPTVEPEAKPAPTPFDAKAVDLTAYVGRFSLPGGFAHLDTTLHEGHLWFGMSERPGSERPCEPTAPDRFSCGLEFRSGADGRKTGVSFALFEFTRAE
jgi:CubicO group peptidase (beta-lactamase class C family)